MAAYSILRKAGIPLGKADYVGYKWLFFKYKKIKCFKFRLNKFVDKFM